MKTDENEGACGACKRAGVLICCEGCPAAFHFRCAGYECTAEVPGGDWYCWFCAKERGQPYMHPNMPFKPPRQYNYHVMLASDDTAEAFYRCKPTAISEGYVELHYTDIEHEDEIVHRSSVRLWHGTTDKNAWSIDADGVTWRPHCRLLQVDKEALAAQQQAVKQQKPLHQQQQQQQPAAARPAPLQTLVQEMLHPQQQQQFLFRPVPTVQSLQQQLTQQQLLMQQRDRAGHMLPDVVTAGGVAAAGGAAAGGAAAAGPRPPPPATAAGPEPPAANAAGPGGMELVPEGEIGEGLPVVIGGSGKAEFDAALADLWREVLGPGYPTRMPPCLLMAGQQVEPWHLWREVWAWGGPDLVSSNKLWATIGFSFNPPASCTSVGTRIKRSYDKVIAPLDQVIESRTVDLQRPSRTRQPRHRALQIRPPPVPGSTAAGSGVRRSRPSNAAGGSGRSRGAGGKRKRGNVWSSDEDDEPAPDFGSDFEDEGEDDDELDRSDKEFSEGGSGGDEQEQEEQDDEEGAGGASPAKLARTVASSRAAAATAGGGGGSGSGPEEVIGRPALTPAAQQIKVGQVVDYRWWLGTSQGPGCASGWRSGTVLALDPGSHWEGGARLLIQPRHHHHHHHHHSKSAPPGTPKPPDSHAAAAALAAVAAVGLPAAGDLAGAAQKLLTPSGHLRHELAGLMNPYRPGSPQLSRLGLSSTGSLGSESSSQGLRQQLAAAGGAAAGDIAAGTAAAAAGSQPEGGDDRPVWVPLLHRGPAQQPFAKPIVLVRPHYVPTTLVAAAAAARLNSSGSSPHLEQQQLVRQQLQQQHRQGQPQQQQQQRPICQLSPGLLVEVLRQGSWWPATVLDVKGSEGQQDDEAAGPAAAAAVAGAAAPASSEPSSSVSGAAGGSVGGGLVSCVVLKNFEPPEADGLVWRCSAGHTMRPAHPQHASGYSVLAARQDDLMPLHTLRKQIAPYVYAGGIQAYSCLSHLKDTRGSLT